MVNSIRTAACPACNEERSDQVERIGRYRILRCQSCKLSFSDPMSGGDAKFYSQHIVYKCTDATSVYTHYQSAQKAINYQLLSMVPARGKVLDIGCGYGAFVKVALEAGFDAYGVDLNPEHIHAGRSVLGLAQRLVLGSIEELSEKFRQDEVFDLITLFEVIEHIEEPAVLIRNVLRLLKPGGIIAISCPNENRWQPTGRIFVDYPPHHLTRWRPDTMRAFLERNGFVHVITEFDSSFRDLLWVTYSNRSAKKMMTAVSPHPEVTENSKPVFGGQQEAYPSTKWTIKTNLDRLVRVACAPIDIVLKALHVGTMGMRVIARKPNK